MYFQQDPTGMKSHLKMVEKPFMLLAGSAPLLAESCISATGVATGRGHDFVNTFHLITWTYTFFF